MAKKDQQSTKLPKRIGGVKVPKALRSSGGKLLDALGHPLIADVAAAALISAAAALRENEAARGSAGKAGRKAGDAVKQLSQNALSLGAVLAEAAFEGAKLLGVGQKAAAPVAAARKKMKGNGRGKSKLKKK